MINIIKDINNCPYYDDSGNVVSDRIDSRCVILTFNDDSTKIFKIGSTTKQDVIESGDISESFDYEVLYIVYGNIRYDIPDGANVYIEDDYILSKTDEYDSIEGNTRLYRIHFNLKHSNLDSDIDISIVASGTKIYSGTAPYKTYNVGNDVIIQVNKNEQLPFKVIERSDGFKDTVTLLYNGSYDSSLVYNRTDYNNLGNLGNRYKNSSIKTKLERINASWNNIDEIRLITVDDIARISSFCPQYRGVNSSDVSLATSPDWLINQNYWTMSEKLTSDDTNGKKVWVVDGSRKTLTSDFINANYAVRPVIVVKKTYITN